MDGHIDEREVCFRVGLWLSGLMDKTPVRKTGNLRFKSQLRHKFFSQYLSTIQVVTPRRDITHKFFSLNKIMKKNKSVI